ncbi:hypothetical protein K458DRAFT_415510 [Lentithecium fluviatile CBS 122367]|uniref:Uncharacterized protein n=1 Tax=Lentithecium fluviatile CBS 122367 TaxID=1168545 RepID=A0A6G1J9P6_9PLEO|nr:hypothetical protein K458DRAFT_415510 [Lentithecium fluviatile CBS 122367]
MDAPRLDRIGNFDWRYWPPGPVPHQLFNNKLVIEHSCHPELEDHSTITWGLSQCERSEEKTATVDVLEVERENVRWRYSVDDDELEKTITEIPGMGLQERSLRVFFLSTLQSRIGYLPGNFTFRPRTLRILQKAGLSGVILGSIFSADGNWANMGSHCFTQNDNDSCLSSFEVSYRYICGWDSGKAFIQFLRTRYQTTYFCINCPSRTRERFEGYLAKNPKFAFRDFFIDALIADDSLKMWQEDIGERRNRLLDQERKYKGEDIEFDTATRQLHKLSYDWHTLGQDCRDHLAQLDFIQRTYEKYMTRLQDPKNEWQVDKSNDMGETFEALKSTCDNCTRWTTVYRERTNIRINLLFHLAAQSESRTSTQIAASTAKVAEQTQRDSASMITIAAVTMFFLPGTFICAVLSTAFFDYGENSLEVSRKWWILPASMIPMTAGVFAVWLAWRWWKLGRHQDQLSKDVREVGRKKSQ